MLEEELTQLRSGPILRRSETKAALPRLTEKMTPERRAEIAKSAARSR